MPAPTFDQRLATRVRPQRAPVMYQTWDDLLFVHWEIDPADIQATLPPGLTVDTWEGKAYVGLVPFFMRKIRPTWFPAVPWLSYFLEMNMRTYVYDERGVSGVWFYALDCDQPIAVRVARTFFALPYFDAKMSAVKQNDTITYQSQRRKTTTPNATYTYQMETNIGASPEQTLDFFLLERYILFSYKNGQLYSGQVNHTPYERVTGKVTADAAHWLEINGFKNLNRPPDHTIMSPGVDVDVFPIQKVV